MKRQQQQSPESRIAELEKELEIEAAMDRIRARAMAMHTSGELVEVADVLREQMGLLGQPDLETTAVHLYDDNSNIFESLYAFRPSYGPEGKSISASTTFPIGSCELVREMLAMYRSPVTDYTLEASGAKRQEWFEVLQKAAPEIVKYAVTNEASFPETTYFHFSDFRGGTLVTVSYQPPSEEVKSLLRRAASVFDLAYCRFTDLKKAEAQAREAQIELGLERVRARAMAMQNSDELAELVTTLFNELSKLHFTLARCLIWIIDAETLSATTWMANPGVEAASYQMQYFDHPYYKGIIKAWKARKPKWAYELKGEEKRALDDIVLNLPALKNTPEVVKAAMRAVDHAVISFSFANFGGLQVDGTEPLSEDNIDILGRFSKVFDQTYTRFSDLQKAEAQAREAKIEAALEKVRSQSLGMHKTEELQEVVSVVFEKLQELEFVMEAGAIIFTFTEGSKDVVQWIASPGQSIANRFVTPFIDHPIPADLWRAKERGKDFFAKVYSFKEKNVFFKAAFELSEYKFFPDDAKKAILGCESYSNSVALAKNSAILIPNYNGKLFSEQENDILKRFARVFEQAYVRFLELQKAEAQARESQIEAALERVRSRTMAMQKSEELAEVIQVIFDQFVLLNFNINAANFSTDFLAVKNEYTIWVASANLTYPARWSVPHFDHPAFNILIEAKESGADHAICNLTTDETKQFWGHFFKNTSPLPEFPPEIRDRIYNSRGYYNYTAIMKAVSLSIVNYSGYAYTEAEEAVIMRFGKVFAQTYTRFKDLEQAEEQARESQIQLALERVRARTMAMQKSEELAETASVLFQQLLNLGIRSERTIIGIPKDETGKIEFWGTEQGGNQINTRFEYEANATYAFREIYKAWQEKRNELTVILKGKNLEEHVNYVRNVLHVPLLAGLVQKQRMLYNAFFSKGWLEIVTPDTQSKETLDILQRFAGVFDATYTRFLDLQKAEAQAREAQIQLALERVRARTMAMQKSEELAETASVLFQQLLDLGISSERTFIGMPNDDTRKIELWGTEQGGNQMSMRFEYEADATYAFREIYKAWRGKRSELTVILEGKNLDEHVNYVRNVLHMPLLIRLVQKQRILYNAFFSKGLLMIVTPDTQSKETLDILRRFAGVFDGTYTRFLDLQKAEEQAREAKIETALERVRAVAMSMMRSDELVGVCESIYIQLNELGFTNIRDAQIYIRYDEQREFMNYSFSDYHGAEVVRVGYDSHPRTRRLFDAIQNTSEAFVEHDIAGEELKNWKAYLKKSIKQKLDKKLQKATELHYYLYSIGSGALGVSTFRSISDEELNILKRFRNVFNLSYQRYSDIARAEAQAREAKIETALERVRSRTMAMFKSDELAETAVILFQQLAVLGISPDRVFIGIFMEETGEMECWATDQVGHQINTRFIGKLQQPSFAKIYGVWKAQEKSFSLVQTGKELEDYINYFSRELGLPFKPGLVHAKRVQNVAFFSNGLIGFTTAEIPPPGIINILERFAGVFNLTYTRFLDLQKAEGQAREAKIEAALERVRSRTMAMFKSDELAGTSVEVFKQLIGLGIQPNRLFIGIINDDSGDIELWATNEDGTQISTKFTGNINRNGSVKKMHAGWKAQKRSITIDMKGKELKEYFSYLKDELKVPFKLGLSQKRRVQLIAYFSQGFIGMASPEPQPEATTNLLERFAGVFNLTYTRFRDLQKAEAQARDAKIEASLERLRSKTMAMHNSNDVGETVAVMFDELVKLGVETTSRLGILIVDNTSHMEVWTASADAQGKTSMRIGRLDMTIHPILQALHAAWKNKETMFSYLLAGEDMKAYYRAINNSPDYPSQFNLDNLPKRQEHNSFIFPEGAIFIFSLQPLSIEITQIFKKFAGVFGQTYRRYLDLQRAETQAREAQIEASLERVRGKALAMYNSKDLSSTASLVFTELRKLGVNSKRCGVALLSKNSRHTQLYVATTTLDTDSLDLVGAIELSGHPSLEKQYESWLKNEDYFTVLKGEELKSYKELIYSMLPVPYDHTYHEEFGYYLAFSEGFLFSWAGRPFSEIEINILNRFKSIIDLTFRRYIELQKSEANAREAIRQSSLDRVRAEIASMRTTGDLDRITPLIWNELTTLGVPFIRCGVFIMDEPQQLIHTYLSTPDGKAIAAFQLHFNADTGNGVNGVALQGWRQKQAVTLHWTEEEFRTFSHSLMEQGEIASEEGYLTEHPPAGLDLHFFPFTQGMLYAGNTEPLSDEDKDLVQSLADAFSTAYARYEDFNRLELAKQQVENTLSDLKLAQTKLVQSEKMASLGELTAGIAHEIQNPLNFVNNFSEVNQEMIEELEEELNAGNIEEALVIIADIKQNEQKINHHGKRADGIVKGMLEHSRTGGGEKQPININALADEFMRLSYHGLRAKDKVFNAEMVTNFDPDLPKINVVGQDIGRVILNLFNNAFYAVNQKKRTAEASYKPEVSVTTSAEKGRVCITVKDNGIGIPDAIKEKIMQPFFTTKPTGEGTGLGLSLTYDMVVKGHGGSIQVNSIEGEGSEFIISLPIS